MANAVCINNLRRVNISDVLQPNFILQSENTYLSGVILVVKKFDRPLKTFKTVVNKFEPPVNEGSYDRMIIIGELKTTTCFVIISETSMSSGNLFRHDDVAVGSYVAIEEPFYSEHCLGNDPSNPIVTTTKSLLPLPQAGINLLNLDINFNPAGTAMYHFAINDTALRFLQAQFVSPTCAGILCDRRNLKNLTVCGCVQKSTLSGWTIQARVVAEENDIFGGVFFQSHAFAKLMCTVAILRQPVANVVEANLRNAVQRVAAYVNEAGGWTVEGFVKSGISDENIAQSVQQVRICRIAPNCIVPDNIKYDVRPFIQEDNLPPPVLAGAVDENQKTKTTTEMISSLSVGSTAATELFPLIYFQN